MAAVPQGAAVGQPAGVEGENLVADRAGASETLGELREKEPRVVTADALEHAVHPGDGRRVERTHSELLQDVGQHRHVGSTLGRRPGLVGGACLARGDSAEVGVAARATAGGAHVRQRRAPAGGLSRGRPGCLAMGCRPSTLYGNRVAVQA